MRELRHYLPLAPASFAPKVDWKLPALMSRLGTGQRLRIWSAGFCSGEEPYSVAMLLDQEGWLARADILAMDLNPQALERARSGMYREWSLRGLAEPMRLRYFQATGS